MLRIRLATLAALLTLLPLSGCASSGAVSRDELNQTISIRYGILQSVEEVELQSRAGSGALLGGIIGAAAADDDDQVEGAIAGAVVGGLLTRLTEGRNRAWAYTVELSDGSTVQVITEQEHVEVGHCVSFEQGKHTNIRQVADLACEEQGLHPEVVEAHQEDAARCHAAKDELLAATTEEAASIAARKVEALCNH